MGVGSEILCYQENMMINQVMEGDEGPSKESFCPFTLPADVYGDMMFAKRLAPEGFISPPSVKHTRSEESEVETQTQSTVADNEGRQKTEYAIKVLRF